MTPELLLELARLPMFPRAAAELLRISGAEATAALVRAWGGQEWPVPRRVGGSNARGALRYEQLVEIVGAPAAAAIITHWSGGRLQIPNLKEVRWAHAQDLIRADFDQLTTVGSYSYTEAVFELGIKYKVTGKAIENILKRPDNEKHDLPAQGSLF